jgi:hypothetical protein
MVAAPGIDPGFLAFQTSAFTWLAWQPLNLGGYGRSRTGNLSGANRALSQLSYAPTKKMFMKRIMGGRRELNLSRFAGV